MPGLADLPSAALVAVLRHVPREQRQRDCARVCRAWAAAVDTLHWLELEASLFNQAKADALTARLARPPVPHVERLRVVGWSGVAFELPAQCLAQLRELAASGLRIRAPAASGAGSSSSSSASAGSSAPWLTRLVLDGRSMAGACECLQPPSALSTLRELEISSLMDAQEQQQVGQLLPHATQLTALCIYNELPPQLAAAGLAALGQLQQLQLWPVRGSVTAWLPSLPGALTRLAVVVPASAVVPGLDFSDASASARATAVLGQLSRLQQLRLDRVQQLPPAALAALTGLRHLHLSGTTAGGAAGLLGVLPLLQQLQHLELELGQSMLPNGPLPPQLYAALTASSQLTQLKLPVINLAPGAAQHMFGAPGRALPHLRVLLMDGFAARAIDREGLAALVACCPGLQELTLWSALGGGAQVELAPLAQLSALSMLHLGDPCCTLRISDAALAQLARCTALRSLKLNVALADATAAGVRSLAAQLKLLTSLYLPMPYRSGGPIALRNQAPAGAPPDVWRQLEAHCMKVFGGAAGGSNEAA